ncbi:hypothetical protein DRF67_00115 [Chryseobacterium pennipullorum]|uniref:Uncharacterized protein n=1 Tax=Chryseobacterium pennipullorum TaxID=2258963 RepID=A0A3D9BAK6_9FLAO|nr:hypothetical protein DRF67_00115 [Chryseobacterium pennipullorum]
MFQAINWIWGLMLFWIYFRRRA